MSTCGNEDFSLPEQIFAIEKTLADECRPSTTKQGFALVPIANGAGHSIVIDERCRERWVLRLRWRASFRAGPFRARQATFTNGGSSMSKSSGIHQPLVDDIGHADPLANMLGLAREVSPSYLPAKSKASK
jgi:hypothetical protein